jgi:hypothetical protein
MKRWTYSLVFALLLLCGTTQLAPAQERKGKLGEFVDDYGKKKDKKDKDEKKKNKKANNDDDSDGGGWFSLLIDIIFSSDDDKNEFSSDDDKEKTAEEPRESSPPGPPPPPKLSPPLKPALPPKPAPFPYRDNRGLPVRSADYRNYGIIAEAGYLHLGDGLKGFQFAGDICGSRLAANIDVHSLIEDLGTENQTLTFLGVNAGYEIIATPYLLARPYFGARNMLGLGANFWGPEIGAKLFMFPSKPLSVETNFSRAQINGKPLTIASGTVGIMINRVELRLGGQLFRSEWTSLDGVKLGMRIWF